MSLVQLCYSVINSKLLMTLYSIKLIVSIILYDVFYTESDSHLRLSCDNAVEYVLMVWLMLRSLIFRSLWYFCATTFMHCSTSPNSI